MNEAIVGGAVGTVLGVALAAASGALGRAARPLIAQVRVRAATRRERAEGRRKATLDSVASRTAVDTFEQRVQDAHADGLMVAVSVAGADPQRVEWSTGDVTWKYQTMERYMADRMAHRVHPIRSTCCGRVRRGQRARQPMR